MVRRLVSRLSAFAALCAFAGSAEAQTGSITGKVTGAENGVPVVGARVTAVSGLRTAATVVSGDNGSYRISGLVAGTYVLTATRIGFSAKRVEGVTVPGSGAVTVDLPMVEITTRLNEVVTTVTRGATPEKILDAPASISVVNSEQITNVPAATIADYLKATPGLSVSTGGMMQSNIVSRGFNNAFSGSMLVLQDYRFSGVPSLRVNVPALFTGTSDDIERIEIVNGPAAALYGPNAADGVLHIITKSPFTSKGTTISVDGGGNSMLQGSFRHAGVFGDNKWGYKLSGSYFTATDWKYNDPNEPAIFPTVAGSPRSGQPLVRDFADKKYSGEFRLDYKPNADFDNIINAGYSKIVSGIDITTAFGAVQAKNWSYTSLQDRLRYKRFFAQVFYNANNSGNSTPQDASGTFYLRTGIPVVDQSTVTVAQVQQSFDLGKAVMVAGFDYIFTHPYSDSTIFGRNEGTTNITEKGIYLQGTIPLSTKLDLMAAIRGDQTDRLAGSQFSPRVAFVYKADENNNFRFTFSRAFSSPASFEYMLDQLSKQNQAPLFNLRAEGNPSKSGWQFARNCDATVNTGMCMHSPFVANGPLAFVSSTSANAFPGFMSSFATIAASLPASSFASTSDPTGVQSKAGFLGIFAIPGMTAALNSLRPTDAQVGSVMRLGSTAVPVSSITDIQPLSAAFNTTWEVGYKGILGQRLRLAVDLWYQIRGDVGVPIGQINPLVFMDPAKLTGYLPAALTGALMANGYSQAQAQGVVGQVATSLIKLMAGLPQGALAFTNTKLAPDQSIIASYTNGVGQIDVRGADVAVDYQVNDRWMLATQYTNIGQNVFPQIGGAANALMSNSPKHRASGTATYTNDASGWSFNSTVRYADAFPVNSGLFNSFNPNPTGGAAYAPIPASTQIDVGASWRLPFAQGVTWSLNVSDLLDTKVATFVGVPLIGRLIATRIRYTF